MSETERYYPIVSHDYYGFYTGVRADDQQVLMGLSRPNLAAFFFDSEGELLTVEQRPLSFFDGVTPPYNIYDERIPPCIDAWKRDMGFEPAMIRVKKFFSQQLYIGIEDYPSLFDEVLSDPEADEEEKDDIRDSMKLWDESGQFVLWWGNDYWLDNSGRVVSS